MLRINWYKIGTKGIFQVENGQGQRQTMLDSILHNGRDSKDMVHHTINAGEEALLQTRIEDVVHMKEFLQSHCC